MGCEVSFRVLGTLDVAVKGRPVRMPTGKQRVLLASLLVDANEAVPVESLVDRLWGSCLPSQPRSALHTLLTRLRQTLDADGYSLSETVHTSASGYSLQVCPDQLDLLRFRELLAVSRRLADAGDLEAERGVLADALALWRGTPLSDVHSDALNRDVVPALTEQWIRAIERYHDVCLRLGRHEEIIGELRILTARHPFHERLWHQLMLALHRCGRRGEALEVYAHVSGFFREQMGIDPGSELRGLQLAILRADATPASVAPG
ncbi:AfsR/SARP family transcriptional regulator [Streptomyces africanus]|uniref:AfsR/SARP family transcriptional regulator n=1 Tax=Streptomyces africanus TaxID=231024 RepID=UPI000A38DD05|nr:AfsR/SARP family transcriptional regulator [Streptomyces africanus]